jgi:putative membrane protein
MNEVADILAGGYNWLRAFHVIAVISWMAGMLYLPRLFVYHTRLEPGSPAVEIFKLMEARLIRIIMTPAMIVVWSLGILLAITPGVIDWSAGWVHVKLACVLGMTGFHLAFMSYARAFAEDRNRRSERFFRIINEGPTLLMIVIVIMVIVRPL